MIQLCRYILQGGNQCQQAAINGEHYCRHHLVVRRTVAANTPKQNPYRIEKPLALVFPEDRAALMIDVFVVMQAFNEGDIGPKSANIFTRLLHECGVILKQGPLYEVDLENAVRRVVVTPEGEEIAPAREVPESSEEAVSSEAVSEEAASEETASGETVSGEAVSGEAVSGEAVSEETVSEETVSEEQQVSETVPHTSKSSLCGPPDDFGGCKDPCYIENVTRRREQYRQFATYELAAGLDPRPWEEFNPGKSRVRKPKTMVG